MENIPIIIISHFKNKRMQQSYASKQCRISARDQILQKRKSWLGLLLSGYQQPIPESLVHWSVPLEAKLYLTF